MEIPSLIEKQKHYFGTYSVMALLNAQTVLDHIQKLADLGTEASEDYEKHQENLWSHPVMEYIAYWNTQKAPEKVALIIEKLQSYFPFLRIMAENQRRYNNDRNQQDRPEVNCDDIYNVLNRVFRVVKTYRDCTTHYAFKDDKFDDGSDFLRKYEQVLATMINKYFDVALRDLKERYSYSTEELAYIQNYRYRRVFGNDGRKTMEPNLSFFFSLLDYNGDSTKARHLSGYGVALLVCLLLDKQYVNQFATHLPAIQKYGAQAKERKALVRSLGIHSIILPKDRIHTLKDNMSIAMDMLNELKRCPAELFDTLSPAGQSRFRIMSSDHNEVLLRRSTDRFAQLALQYIDYNHLFNGIRFHVNMGKLRYLFNAEKNCIDGMTRVRVLEHALNGYGRLEEMENMRKNEDGTFACTGIKIRDFEQVKRDDADSNSYPYVVDTYTHYMLENNKIEMLLTDKPVLPDVKERVGKWYAGKTVPTCRMSVFELPAMIFHSILLGGEATEKRIREVCAQYGCLFDALQKGEVNSQNIRSFGIAESDIPQKILDIAKGCAKGKNVEQFTEHTVSAMLADTQMRIERLRDDRKAVNSADNRMGKRGFRQIKRGKIASFLAQDIVRFQPTFSNGTDKLTGLNYRVLQSSLAVYDSMGDNTARQNFKEMFVKARLLGANPATFHPFLHKVFARTIPDNTIDFYERYLAERDSYLSAVQKKVVMGKSVSVPFINREQSKWHTPVQETLGKAYTDGMAIELPRQMFDNDIKAHLMTLPQMESIDFDNANVTYLIDEYLKRVCGDNSQPFYSWQRNYRYIDMLKCETDRRNNLCSSFTSVDEREGLWRNRQKCAHKYVEWARKKETAARGWSRQEETEPEEAIEQRMNGARNDYQKSEKTIRRFKAQDVLLFLMAKNTLTSVADWDGEQFRLEELMPDAEKGILSKLMPMTFSFEKNGNAYTIRSNGMKLKNYGDFFVIANDRRICSLLDLVEKNVVDKDDVTRELQKYDQCRPEVAKLVLDFEKWTYSKFPDLKNQAKVQFKDVLDKLCNKSELTKQQRDVLSEIRNAFEHNNYPKKGIVEITTLPQIAENMKNMFGEYAEVK